MKWKIIFPHLVSKWWFVKNEYMLKHIVVFILFIDVAEDQTLGGAHKHMVKNSQHACH